MNSNDANYITKVFGLSNFGKNRVETPLFVEEQFQTMLTYGYNKGYIRGINSSLISLPGLRNPVTTNTIANYLEQYKSPESPWVVSQLYGSTVERLFKFYSIADGNSANTQIKISIQNISFNNLSFDVAVRDFFDTDANPVILEKYTNCTMDPTTNNYIAVKIGTSDGEYALNSKYIMLEMDVDANPESLPCGFEGYVIRNYGSATPPFPVYKVSYNFPGEVIYNPPFGIVTNPPFTYTGFDNKAVSGGDRVRSTYLGISSQIG
jgi:hypothetical protein